MLTSNRNQKIKLIPLLLILMTVFSIFSYGVHAKSGANVDMEDNYSFAKILLSKDGDTGKNNGYLLPQRRINLLDINSDVVAEYIEFQSESREYVGYIIIDVHSGHIYDYSNEGNLFEGLLIKSGLTYDDVLAGKVYFVNPFEIYVELTDGRIIDLMPQSGIYPSEITRSQLEQTFSLREDNYSFAKILLSKDGDTGKNNGYLLPQRRINLLDINSDVVAEYIEFQSESREYVGYIIIDVHSGHIYDYSNEGNLFEGLLIKSGLTYDDVLAGKVYFVNPFEIYVELTDGRIIDLMPQSAIYPSEITRSQLEQTFSLRQVEYKSPIEPELKSLEVPNTTLMRSASFTPCVTSDFDNLKIVDANGRRVYPHDHCSPTAATTIMKYFKHLGESNLSSSYSNNDVFAKFYIAMDTNGGTSGTKDEGTARSKIAPSYTKVGRDLGAKPKKSSKLSGTSSNTMISALNGGKLLHVSVDKLGSSKGGHSIATVSYSNGYFKIADGWSAYFRNVSYSDMSVKQVVGINY